MKAVGALWKHVLLLLWSDVAAAEQQVFCFSEYWNCQTAKTAAFCTLCVFLWPPAEDFLWPPLFLRSESWLLSALPVSNEHLDESWRSAARVDTANQRAEVKQRLFSPIRWSEIKLWSRARGRACCHGAYSNLLLSARHQDPLPVVKHIMENGRLIVCFKDSICSFAAELCCETSFYHPSPRSTHLPSLSASALRWQLFEKLRLYRSGSSLVVSWRL